MPIDPRSKNILKFRPKIDFIEPDQQESPIEAVPEPATPQEVEEKRLKVKNLADSVNNLARAVQLKIDNKAKDQIIILDAGMDNAVIRALRRSYPNASNFDRITYDQYKRCKDRLREYAAGVALRATITDGEVADARRDIEQGKLNVGGIGTEEATNGGLRPELDEKNRLIEPLDMEALQEDLLKMLFEMLYELFIQPILSILPFIGGDVKDKPPGDMRPSQAMRQMSEDVIARIKQVTDASKETRDQIESGDYPRPSATTATEPDSGLPDIQTPVQFQDCQMIVKTYEKGCHASHTEASVFAPMTSQLDFMRNMSETISQQMDQFNPDEKEPQADRGVSDFLRKLIPDLDLSLSADLGSVGFDFGPLKDCIPCGFRITFKEELNAKISVSDIGAYILEMMFGWLQRALSQIRNLIDMFKNLDSYIDICSFLDFLKDFVCIPDLAKILAVLAALLMDLSFELNAIVDFAISLIVPLFVPFLTNLLDSLMKYVFLILEPIECIIDSIQDFIGKLDYNVLFQNIPNEVQLLSPNATKIPILGSLIPEEGVSFDLAAPQRAQRAREQEAIDKAYANLQRLKKAANGIDASDQEAYEKYKEQERAARQAYKDAIQERDLSELGEANLAIEQFQTQLRGTILQLVSLLREAILRFETWVRGVFDEFKKLLNEYVGGTGIYINFGVKKLAIIQMIAFVKAVIDLINGDIQCDPGDEVEAYAARVSKESGFKVFSDDDGNIYIEENLDEIDDIADALNVQGPDSLINYTGDDVLDAMLDDTVKKLTIPNSLKIKCSLISSVADQDKVNKWISELGDV